MNDTASQVSRARALAAFLIGCAFFVYAFVHRVLPSVMTDELMRDFAVGGSALGVLSAMYFYAYVALQIPVGILIDRFGPRRLMSGALLVCACASLGMANSDTLVAASISRFIIGGSVAFAFVGTLTLLTFWFDSHRFATFAGVLQSAGMLGAMLGQAPLRIAVEELSWRGATTMLAVCGFTLAILAYALIPRRPAIHRNTTTPETRNAGVGSILKKPRNWLCALVGFGMAAPMLGFAALWAVPWLNTVHGFDQTTSAGIASTVFLGWLAGAPVCGWISDVIGRRLPVLFAGSLLSLTTFVTIMLLDNVSATVFIMLFFFNGLVGCTMVICFSVMREYNASSNTAASLGMLNTLVVGSGAVMQPLIGGLLDHRWNGTLIEGVRIYTAENYLIAFMALILANVMAIGCCLLLKETYCQEIYD